MCQRRIVFRSRLKIDTFKNQVLNNTIKMYSQKPEVY